MIDENGGIMKLYHETNYVLYDDKLSNDIKICILSDLHFSNKVSDDKLENILKKIQDNKPDYLFFCGDIIDKVNEIECIKERERLLDWFKNLSLITTCLISIGNHDFYRYDNNQKKGNYYYSDIFDELDSYDNIYVLNNKSYCDNNISVTGYTQSPNYYLNRSNKSLHIEDKELMIQELKELKKNIGKIPNNKVSFLLAHSPIYLKDKDVIKNISEYDYFISGHMHNGCVPPILYEIWNSSYGIISPKKKLLQDNARNTLKYKNDKLIVNGPLTMFQRCSGIMPIFNIMYPTYLTNLLLTTDSTYNTEKVYKKTKYSKWYK